MLGGEVLMTEVLGAAHRPVRLWVIHYGARFRCCGQQIECGCDDAGMTLAIVDGSERSPHWESGEEGAGEHHLSGSVLEGFHHDRHRWNALCFQTTRNVSDRHMANRSDRDKEHGIDRLTRDGGNPFVDSFSEPAL